MKNIIEAAELPEGEKVYLKKSFDGWRVVQPIRNEDGTTNWFNLLVGGKKGIVILLFILLVAGLLYVGTVQLIGNYKLVADNPCKFCHSCFPTTIYKYREVNFSNLNLSGG